MLLFRESQDHTKETNSDLAKILKVSDIVESCDPYHRAI
jgi:hypothetical protein